jgi:mannose-6-phosphate isomerase-like protein (cupin superfamily)
VSATPHVVDATDSLVVRSTFGPATGCELLEQAVLGLPSGATAARATGPAEEVLYVLRGTGVLRSGDASHPLEPDAGAAIAPGHEYAIEAFDELELVSVVLPAPVRGEVPPVTVVMRAEQEHGTATADRDFRLVSDPDRGCLSATQFVGRIPPGRAPEHYHHYDEVIYVLEGSGVLHLETGATPVTAGCCIHLPAHLKHSLENVGDASLEVLGVFRPAGSPSEAYYPDGTPAMTQHGGATR